jgi:nucleotide-binding universal stress UspA family protein
MKFLVPVNASTPDLAAVEHIENAVRAGAPVEVLVLNVQPRFNQRVSRFSSRADRDAFRMEHSRAAMAAVLERLARKRIPFRAIMVIGAPGERIAEVARAEAVDEILIAERRRPRWLRWLMPSPAQEIAAYTDIPVTVVARGKESPLERYVIPGLAGLAALAAFIFSAEY